jgi:hypothetical protein
MAYSPIAFIAPNYRDYGTYWLKAYTPGSTSPKILSIDLAGTTTFAKLQLNVDGFFRTAGGALITPYIDGSYDAYLFQTEAEADANNTAGAVRIADDITPITTLGSFAFTTTTEGLIATTGTFSDETIINTSGYTASGDKGHGRWKQNGVTGGTPSQSPTQLGNLSLLNDGNGNQWAKVNNNSYLANGSTFSPYYTPAFDTRVEERVYFGSAARDAGGTTSQLDSNTFIAGYDFGSWYLERSAQSLSINKRGGIGTVSGARSSDRYTSLGYTVWLGTTAYIVGDKKGYGGRLYTATVAGTTSATPPSHTSGTATDGTVTWQFDDYTYNVSIGEAAVSLVDIDDGSGGWARYTEIVRLPAGGTSYAHEIAVKNKGSNVINNPYNRFPQGTTLGDMYAGGGDPILGAPTAPSTCAILLIKNGHTFNKGIVFDKEAITGATGTTGFGEAISLGLGHIINWYTPEGLVGAEVVSSVTLNSRGGAIAFRDNETEFKSGGTSVLLVKKLSDSSTGSVIIESYGGNARISADGTATDVDFLVEAKGAGLVRFGTHAALSGETVTGYITIKDAGGASRKLAVVS